MLKCGFKIAQHVIVEQNKCKLIQLRLALYTWNSRPTSRTLHISHMAIFTYYWSSDRSEMERNIAKSAMLFSLFNKDWFTFPSLPLPTRASNTALARAMDSSESHRFMLNLREASSSRGSDPRTTAARCSSALFRHSNVSSIKYPSSFTIYSALALSHLRSKNCGVIAKAK